MASMSVSGVVSGMDWDSMIDSIIEAASKPAQPKVSKKTNLTNKKSLFEEMKVTMNSLQSSLSPLKLPSTYKAKDIEIERLDNAGSSYKGVLTATVNADAEVNVWEVEVKQLAAAQTNRSKQITDSTLANTLSGVTGSTFYVNAGGQKIGVEVKSSDTLQSLKSRINETLKTLDNPIHVTASVVDNRLILKSDYTGLGTFNSEEKVNYNATGINRLSNFSVNDDERKNVSILNGSTKYTYGTDFEIVNGNEIRWKQYDRSPEVPLNDTVKVTYNMAAGDTYKDTGTYGTEASISGFTMADENLASRLKIVDDNDVEYIYGQDFTITNNKVVWLEEKSASTNEPSSYTVSYNKTQTVSTSINGTKGTSTVTYTDEPDSYIVRYDGRAQGSYEITQSKSGNVESINIDYNKLCELYKNTTGDDIQLFSKNVPSTSDPNRMIYYLDPPDRSALNITAGGTTYEYGRDFVIKTANNTPDTSNGNWEIVWSVGTIANEYRNSKGISSAAQTPPSNGTSMTFSMAYDYGYTQTAKVSSSDNDKLLTTVFGSDFDMANFDGTKLTIRGYSYGTDYTVDDDPSSPNYGEIQWLNKTATSSSVDDALSDSDFTTLQNAYNQTYGTTSIPTVTLTDGDGVLRTYLDPADSSLFKMTSGGQTYEYGKDYVIRVNDNHKGYSISWAISNDVNGDSTYDINDANTVVTTYTQYKNLTTYDMKKAPDSGNSYNLTFTGTSTKSASGAVTSSATDKTLATVLSGTTVSSSDYSSALTITSGSKTYTYGEDYVVDKTGTITWLNQNSTTPAAYTANYTFGTAASMTKSLNATTSSYVNVSGVPSLNSMGVSTFPSGSGSHSYVYVNADEGKAAFTMTDSNGNTYEYGKDYAIRTSAGSEGASGFVVVWPNNTYWPTSELGTHTTSMPKSGLTLTYNNSVSRTVISSETVKDALGFIPSTSNYSKLSITKPDGTAYTENTDYTFDQSTGEVTFISTAVAPKHPTGSYTLTYEAAGGEELTTKGVTRSATDSTTVAASDLDGGTTTITYGGKTFYEGIDFNIGKDSSGNATVTWVNDKKGGSEWYYPTSNANYTINHTDDNGNTTTYPAKRNSTETLNMSDYGMTSANGSISVQYGDDTLSHKLDAPDSGLGDGRTVIKGTYGIDITPTTGNSFTFNWAAPTLTSRSNLPSYGTELTVQYTYDANTFDLADDCDGKLLQALGYTKSDGTYDDYTAAQDAEIYVDGNLSYRASNDIGADYDNELIKGVTMHLKGTGKVVLDISQDAEKAVEAIQTFVDNYNDLMTWMNTRMTEKQVDKDTAATIDNDDFRMRWGLLHGNSLLRQTKTQMRNITSQNFTFSFAQRKSSQEVYGTMAFNGLKSSSTLRLRIGSKFADVTIDPTDTLQTIVAKINDDTKNGPMHNIYYDDSGNKLATPLLKASVENDMLVINSTSGDEITMSGSAAMNALKMNYTYKGLYQIGIESTSDDYGKSGELVFNSGEFMDALQDNPDEVQALMLKFVDQFGTWTRSMLNSSASGETEGTLTREINNIQSQIDDINEYLERYQERLDRMEENLRTRYASTETSLAKLNQQASAMASILQQLSGANNNNQQQ